MRSRKEILAMNIIKLFKSSQVALKCEDELSLAHIYGQKLHEAPHLINNKIRMKGAILRSLVFFYHLAKKIKIYSNKNCMERDVFIYAGTQNQLSSLIPTIDGLTELNIQYSLVLGNRNLKGSESFINLMVTPKVAFTSVLLYLSHVIPLYFKLKNQNKNKEIEFAFNVFCKAYIYIPVFLSLLEKQNKNDLVKLIVMSNDHSVENRCLRVVGEVLKIKTLYMQHASVSELFPPLMYDYALLDGQVAFNTYMNCSSNHLSKNNHQTKVFLSGQKKAIKFSRNTKEKSIGIAVNTLDNIEDVLNLLNTFVTNNYTVVIRTHPYQQKYFVDNLNSYIAKHYLITWSNPKEDSLINFFSSVSCVIAANTSIHLEAALAGLSTIYYELAKDINKADYYGYVKNGISFELNDNNLIRSLQDGIEYCNSSFRNEALKRYSETYNTKWESKEGELSASLIKKILCKENVGDLFYSHFSDNSFSVYKIKE